ncbi:MAG: signal recognition particle-docking protein FtsY [Acidimicrobiaceae bacterium]|jgi:fused signal recognition particle receptor|nr:signal recognition particle-docking protein FtsY [Acidimicrobiaceae bacterium]|tara:strand:- start:1982 stop:2887 length:906 start_codon:yes stop_codon:yes gene_type:complete
MKRVTSELDKTRKNFSLFSKLKRKSHLNSQVWSEIEEILIQADVGVVATSMIIEQLQEKAKEMKLSATESIIDVLKEQLKQSLMKLDSALNTDAELPVWIFVGVNGVGKTTSIAKVANLKSQGGKNIVMAAGDTFRAAASEQLERWAVVCGTELIKGADGADPSSVIFDATEHAHATNASLVLADTAGRLHTKANLMQELEKIVRVANKGKGTVTEILLVLDSTVGQNGLQQAKSFAESVDVTGIILTKLDGSSKGGIIFAIAEELKIPIKFIGVGESHEDLFPFDAEEFVEMLFDFQEEM